MTLSPESTEKGLRGGGCIMGLNPGKPPVGGRGIRNGVLGGKAAEGGDAGLGESVVSFLSVWTTMSHLSSSSKGENGLGLDLDLVTDAI